jgi:hypothetical protein
MLLPLHVRGLVAAVPFVLAAALAVIFDVVRTIPVGLSCADETPAGYDAAVAAYHAGSIPLHLGVIVVTLAAIALLGGGRDLLLRSGRAVMTFVAMALLVAVVLGLAERPLELLTPVFLLLAGLAFGLVLLAQPLGPQVTAILAALALLATAVWIRRGVVDHDAVRGPCAALWALATLVSAHLMLVHYQGATPFFC